MLSTIIHLMMKWKLTSHEPQNISIFMMESELTKTIYFVHIP